jgi:chromate reductase, NAD(P)H dehydrogenase (quinone)
MKIIAFGASGATNSINQQFAAYAASLFSNATIEMCNLNNFELPIFTTDAEAKIGVPKAAHNFIAKLAEADLLIISVAEHNGTYTTYFKNIFDWASRAKLKMFEGKNMLLLSTAPGPRGGAGALQAAQTRFPIHGATIVGSFSLPQFAQNFANGVITNPEYATALQQIVQQISQHATTNSTT